MKSRTIALFIVIVLYLCLIPSTMASTEEEQKDGAQLKMEELEAELGEEGMQEVEDYLALQASLPDVVKGMPYSGLAFAGTDPESRPVAMGYIDNFDVSEKEKERYKTGLQDVWDRYPFNITKDDYPFMAELGPMIEAEAFSIYSAEELEAMRTADMSDEPPRHPFMNELGFITTSSARNEEEEGTRKIDYSNSQFTDNNSEQEKCPGFTGIMTTAVVVLCFYLVRKWK